MSMSPALVERYADWCRLPDATTDDGPERRAYNEMHDLVEHSPDVARDVLLAVARSIEPSEIAALVSLGADALEDLLKSDPDKYFATFEREAETDERIAIAMSAVWMNTDPIWKDRL